MSMRISIMILKGLEAWRIFFPKDEMTVILLGLKTYGA
jgi:hypothetical protein